MASPGRASGDLPVGKEWQQGAATSTLIESVTWTSIAPKLAGLPLMASAGGPSATRQIAAVGAQERTKGLGVRGKKPIELARAPYKTPGLVLDFTMWGTYQRVLRVSL
jgi:hypothetical protein